MVDTIQDAYWWKSSVGASVHETVFSYVTALRAETAEWRRRDYTHSLLYHTAANTTRRALRALAAHGFGPVRLNVSKNIVDALTAKIGKNHPAIKAAVDGAEWSLRLRAKRLSKFLNAKLSETHFTRIAPLLFRDACIRGTGIVKVAIENGEILPERVLKDDIVIDPIEAKYGSPRQLHQCYLIAREELLELFPDKKADIIHATEASQQDIDADWWDTSWSSSNTNMIRVIESWHLPSGPEADDGRHTVCLEEATLLSEEWASNRFPFAFIHWSAPDRGFWGTGLVEELAPIQWEIDQVMDCISETLRIGAKMKVFVDKGSEVVRSSLNPKLGAIVEYRGKMPKFESPSPVSEQIFKWLTMLEDRAYKISGVSQLTAQSDAPSRMDSAPALLFFYDLETERFSHQALAYRNLYLDVAELYIDSAKQLYESDEEYAGNWVDRSLVEKIRWEDVDLHRDQFKLRLEATSLLPETTPGKMQMLKELAQIGIAPQQLVGPHMESPDFQRIWGTSNASYNNIERIIEQLEDTDQDLPEPEPYHDLGLALTLVKAAYNEAQAAGAPEEVLERFQEYLINTHAVANSNNQAPVTAPGAPPAPEGGAPAPLPTDVAPPPQGQPLPLPEVA